MVQTLAKLWKNTVIATNKITIDGSIWGIKLPAGMTRSMAARHQNSLYEYYTEAKANYQVL